MRSMNMNGILGGLMQMRTDGLVAFAMFASQTRLKLCTAVGESLIFPF